MFLIKMLDITIHQKICVSIRQRSRARLANFDLGKPEAQQVSHDLEPVDDGVRLEESLAFDGQ